MKSALSRISSLNYRSQILLNLLRQGLFLKASNYLLTIFSMIVRPDIAPNYPMTLCVEPGNLCNLSCALCATGQKDKSRSNKMLKFADFKKVLDKVGKYIINIDLYNWGEPFLNKEIFQIIRYAKKYKIKVEVSSNFNLYNEKLGKEIIASGLDALVLSIHGGTPQTYSKYMKGGDFNKVMKNLEHLIALKKQTGSKTPRLRWRYVVFRHNQHEIEQTAKKAFAIGVDEFQPLPMAVGLGYDVAKMKREIWEKRAWIPSREEFNIYNIKKRELKNKNFDCFWPWEIISIGAAGMIQPCCGLYSRNIDFGNVFSENFRSVWNNRYYQTCRKELREKIINDPKSICGTCKANGFLIGKN